MITRNNGKHAQPQRRQRDKLRDHIDSERHRPADDPLEPMGCEPDPDVQQYLGSQEDQFWNAAMKHVRALMPPQRHLNDVAKTAATVCCLADACMFPEGQRHEAFWNLTSGDNHQMAGDPQIISKVLADKGDSISLVPHPLVQAIQVCRNNRQMGSPSRLLVTRLPGGYQLEAHLLYDHLGCMHLDSRAFRALVARGLAVTTRGAYADSGLPNIQFDGEPSDWATLRR